jgi:hypothetical protein
VKVLGYSERGLVNAFVYDCLHSGNGKQIVTNLLAVCRWPLWEQDLPWTHGTCLSVTALVEKSLSDFGDSDLILLCDFVGGHRVSIFCEFKRGTWLFAPHWRVFTEALDTAAQDPTIRFPGLSSNLFCQLYVKQRLVRAVVADPSLNTITDGLVFEPPLDKGRGNRRRIGDNETVRRALDKIVPFSSCPFFLAVIPGQVDDNQFRELLRSPRQRPNSWDTTTWGYLRLRDLRSFCEEQNGTFEQTLRVFDFNKGQL